MPTNLPDDWWQPGALSPVWQAYRMERYAEERERRTHAVELLELRVTLLERIVWKLLLS